MTDSSPFHLNDLYHTVQGEGLNVGKRALFVRMPFCNLSCSWCDTSFNKYTEWTQNDFSVFALREPCRFAVITGGEPAMHKHTKRVAKVLNAMGFRVAIETNGMFPIPDHIDWVCVSPKRDSKIADVGPYHVCADAAAKADEFKYVVDQGFDFSVLDKHNDEFTSGVAPNHLHWLSPEFTDFKANVAAILKYIEKHPWWRLNLQTHKWIEVP